MNKNSIEEHPTWFIYDSSKIQTFMDCPRKYFYEYVLGWRPDSVNLDTTYGFAIHCGMEVINLIRLAKGPGYFLTEEDISMGYSAFLHEYRKYFKEEDDKGNDPKNAEKAAVAYMAYKLEFNKQLSEERVISTEQAGTIPVDDNRVLHFRLDVITYDETFGIKVDDYKTSKKNSDLWEYDLDLRVQTGTYTHVARTAAELGILEELNKHKIKYNADSVFGMKYWGIILYKASNLNLRKYGNVDFRIAKVRKSYGMMEVWRQIVLHFLIEIEKNMELLNDCEPGEPTMRAFPMNTQSCMKYGVCPFHSFCTSWENPISCADKTPLGYIKERWDPTGKLSETERKNLNEQKVPEIGFKNKPTV